MRDGRVEPVERHGERLRVGERVSLVVRNAGTEQLYAWVFDVGVSGRAALADEHVAERCLARSGAAAPTITCRCGRADGESLFWPRDVPPGSRDETFVVVLADRRGDLSSLASPATARGVHDARDVASLLEDDGLTTREVAPAGDGDRPLRYRIEEVSFRLEPCTQPRDARARGHAIVMAVQSRSDALARASTIRMARLRRLTSAKRDA